MKKLLILIVGVGLAGCVAFVLFAGSGFSAREEPSAIEALVARIAKRVAMPRSASSAVNPVAPTPQILAEARAHFADHCAMCHANNGSGETEIGRNLYPKAPDMRDVDTQSLTDGELFYIITNGVRLTGMPAWGSGDGQDSHGSWGLVHFIRHLPAITDGELAYMRTLNPVSPPAAVEAGLEKPLLEGAPPARHGDHRH